jgi:RNA polymerase sigma-70 factor (ECF subfamily)
MPGEPAALESTATLLELARAGDEAARDRLLARYLPLLRRWARGRLPGYARGAVDTDDLVQITLLRALKRLDAFEPRREGAFLAYLRRILLNRIRDQIRHAGTVPATEPVSSGVLDPAPSQIERAVGRERLEAYERALACLPDRQQEAIILRVEMGLSHRDIAEALGCASANAARMFVARAIVRLSESLDA